MQGKLSVKYFDLFDLVAIEGELLVLGRIVFHLCGSLWSIRHTSNLVKYINITNIIIKYQKTIKMEFQRT